MLKLLAVRIAGSPQAGNIFRKVCFDVVLKGKQATQPQACFKMPVNPPGQEKASTCLVDPANAAKNFVAAILGRKACTFPVIHATRFAWATRAGCTDIGSSICGAGET
jgi:hypothetical protein